MSPSGGTWPWPCAGPRCPCLRRRGAVGRGPLPCGRPAASRGIRCHGGAAGDPGPWAYLPCLPACAVSRCLLAGCNALGDVRLTALSSLLAVVFTLAGGAWLLHSMARDIYFCLPAAAASAALWGQTVWLWRGLRRRLRPLLPAPALWTAWPVCGMCWPRRGSRRCPDRPAPVRHDLPVAGAAVRSAVRCPGCPPWRAWLCPSGPDVVPGERPSFCLGDADTRMLAHKLRTKLQGDSRS